MSRSSWNFTQMCRASYPSGTWVGFEPGEAGSSTTEGFFAAAARLHAASSRARVRRMPAMVSPRRRGVGLMDVYLLGGGLQRGAAGALEPGAALPDHRPM